MTSFFKKLFGKKANKELQNDEEAEKGESLTEETLSSASSAQPAATSTPAPSAFPATKGTNTLFTEGTTSKAPGKSDTPPRGKWRCSKCKRLMDEQVENCSFCGAAKDQ